MAGTNAQFDAQAFRDAISFAMTMGLPQDPSERATFFFRAEKVYRRWDETLATPAWVDVDASDIRLDQNGNPLDPGIRVVKLSPEPVRIPVAVEFDTASIDERPVGSFKPTKASITILDEHWPDVSTAVEVELGGDRYVISYKHPPMGLFDVTIYTVECFAQSET